MAESETGAVKRRAGLGRGLDALLGEVRPATETEIAVGASPSGQVRSLPVGRIAPHPDQPRRTFAEDALNELAESIAQRGVIQPIIVRPLGDRWQIVAGERRWRAAQRARLHEIPAIVRDFSESETLEIALIENIQREDLNPIEEAEGYRRLVSDFGHSQASLAKLVDKSRSHVANLIRLLELPLAVREQLAEGKLTMGHARALIGHDDAETLASEIIAKGLTVRDAEARARGDRPAQKRERRAASTGGGGEGDADIRALEGQLADLLGLRVRIVAQGRDGAGTLSLDYRTLDQLDMLCQRLSGERF